MPAAQCRGALEPQFGYDLERCSGPAKAESAARSVQRSRVRLHGCLLRPSALLFTPWRTTSPHRTPSFDSKRLRSSFIWMTPGDWRLAIGNWRLAIGDWRSPRCPNANASCHELGQISCPAAEATEHPSIRVADRLPRRRLDDDGAGEAHRAVGVMVGWLIRKEQIKRKT